MIDKFSEYRLVPGSVMVAGDKQQPLSVKKVALRELPNESRNITNKPPVNSLPKDSVKSLTPDSGKVAGTKRKQHDGPPSPSYQPQGKNSPLANIVYVRRKLETEQCRMGACVNIDHAESRESRKLFDDFTKTPIMQKDRMQEPKGPEPQVSVVAAGSLFPTDLHKVNNEGWKDRFLRLQMFLKTCDQSNQEDYIQICDQCFDLCLPLVEVGMLRNWKKEQCISCWRKARSCNV